MPSIDDQLTALYVLVDDFLHAHPALARWRRSPNDQPAFSDAEVLTVALAQGCLRVATLKQTHRLIGRNWHLAFPRLCSYAHWIARLHHLAPAISALLVATAQLPPGAAAFYLVDAKPLPLCGGLRHSRVRLLREDGAWFGRTSKGWFFGFKLHLLRHAGGRIVNAVLTPGNWDDRDPLLALGLGVDGGLVLGDGNYQGGRAAELAAEADLLLFTRQQAPPGAQGLLIEVRQGIETTLSQLWHQFLDRVFARSFLGLWDAVQLKLIHYNLRHAGLLAG